jgi:aryl-alcohol dehydrogenase-like predicted oxidoreductase
MGQPRWKEVPSLLRAIGLRLSAESLCERSEIATLAADHPAFAVAIRTPAQIALAWLLAQNPWIVPIPGTTKLHRLDENIGAVSVELTPDDLRDIESAASKVTVQGARYPEKLERMTGL